MVCASTVRDDVGFGLPPVVSHSGLAGRLACLFAVAVLLCVSSAHGQVIEEGGFPVKGGGVSGESFSLFCPSRLVVEAGESVLLSCSATAVPEEGVRYGWESVSGEGLRLLSDAQALAPLFAAPLSGAGKEYAYRLTAMAAGVYRTASLTVTVEGVPGETVGAPVVREECDSFTIPDELGEGCVEDKGPTPFGFDPESEGGFLFPEAPGLPDRPSGPVRGDGSVMQAPPRLECPAAIFLEELETGSIKCRVFDASGEEHLEYSWEPVGSTTRDYLENPRLIPEDSPTPSVVAPEAPAYETLDDARSGGTSAVYLYRLTATSRATGLSSHSEVEVFVSGSRPGVYCPLEVAVEEGETIALDCEGVDPLSGRMDYDEDGASIAWEWEGLWGASTALLDATDRSSPLFTAPAGSAGEEYHYIASMTSQASGVSRAARRRVTVRVTGEGEGRAMADASALAYKGGAPVVTCEDSEIYEATADFTLGCTVANPPSDATYRWTARGGTSGTSLLSATDIVSPTFDVPHNIPGDELYDDTLEDDTYKEEFKYRLTMYSGNVGVDSADVDVTVLEKPDISNIYCPNVRGNNSVPQSPVGNVLSGGPGDSFSLLYCTRDLPDSPVGSDYTFAWTVWGNTHETALSLLSATDVISPYFTIPDVLADYCPGTVTIAGRTSPACFYTATISAENMDPHVADIFVEVIMFQTIAVTCLEPEPVYEGAPDFNLLCYGTENGVVVREYAWSWSPTTLLTPPPYDTPRPTFNVPGDVDEDTDYEYRVTATSPDAHAGSATVTVTVKDTAGLPSAVTCSDPDPVYEGSENITLDCTVTNKPTGAIYSWTGTDIPNRLSSTTVLRPIFLVPDDVDWRTIYYFNVTMSADGVDDVTEEVTVTVLNREALAVVCTDPSPAVYEGTPDITLGCTASGAPVGSTYEYVWTPRGDTPDTALLSAADIASPVFYVPDEVDEDETHQYALTASAGNAGSAAAEVTVTVLKRGSLSVACADPGAVYEGSADVAFDCTASGAPGGSDYEYAWAARGGTANTDLLSATDGSTPTFLVPDEVDNDEIYEYRLTVSAGNAGSATAEVTVTVLNRGALALACADPGAVYEGSADVAFDCTASGAPSGSSYAYSWRAGGATANTDLLSSTDGPTPTFLVPDEVDNDEIYEYRLTVSAGNAGSATAEVTVTVLNRGALALACADPGAVYEGSADVAFDCSASGAPGGSSYSYAWRARGGTANTDLLSATDGPAPTFEVPDALDETTTYEYLLTVSAANAEDAAAEVTITVLNREALRVACADPGAVYEGSADVAFDCTASGAPSGSSYAYSWRAGGATANTDLLSSTDGPTPTFLVPDEVDNDEIYEYRLTVSAGNAGSATAEVTVTVLNRGALALACADPGAVYEGSADVAFDCTASGAPGGSSYSYAWRARGGTANTDLLSATDGPAPTFEVPDALDETTTYEYLLTVSAANAEDAAAEVTITVLNREALRVACADPGAVYEGSADVALDCTASGAPGGSSYEYAWTARGGTADTDLLSATDGPAPTFLVLDEVDSDETYEYLLTVSAENAEDASAEVTVTVLNREALGVACADPGSVYEGSEDITLDCSASGAPAGSTYDYVWAARDDTPDTALLIAGIDGPTPTFDVPDEVAATTTYEYLLTVSAEHAESGSAEVTVTVLNKGALAVVCADPSPAYEGAADFDLDCSASGAPAGSGYDYVWTARGDTPDTALLIAGIDGPAPTFAVPDEVAATTTYEYLLTVSAANAEDASAEVTVTVLNKEALALACADPGSVYEGSEDITLDCSASGAPEGSDYAYAWTASGGTADTDLLSATDIASPTFHVPDEVNGTTTYEYTLTVSAANAEDASAEVTVTVLDKEALALACADPGPVYEGSEDVAFDCTASGAPGGSSYEYAWTARGGTADTDLLSATDIASPTFHVPEEVDATTTYEYTLTVSAANAEDAAAEVTVTVLNKEALALACADPGSVYEGSPDITLDCTASGAPGDDPDYAYAWTARGGTPDTSLLSAPDISSPTFYVPDAVDVTTDYEYLLTVSAANAEDASAEVTVTILNKEALGVACADPGSVYEGSADITLDCSASGAPSGSAYTYAWTARGGTADTDLLSATDIASPTFHVPEEVNGTTTYEYTLTVSAANAEDAAAEVTVTVLNKEALALACAEPGSVYEGSPDITLDCTASGAPGDDPVYTYAWTARGDTPDASLLSATDISSPTFHVPDAVDVTTDYEYLLTVSADNVESATAEVTVTVLDKEALALACMDPGSVYEGSADIAFDCSASGAPEGSDYEYAWMARGGTAETDLLSATDGPAPTFLVPDEVEEDETYEYLLTVSAANAEDASAEVTVTVLDKEALALACMDPGSVYEGSEDIAFDCTASGAPEGSDYEYAWTARGGTADTDLLSATDIASPTFHVPEEVEDDETYEYLLTVSAANAEDAAAEVAVTVLDRAVVPPSGPVSPPLASSSSTRESAHPSALGVTVSVSPLRFGVQSADTEASLDPMTDGISTRVSGPYHAGRMTLSPGSSEEVDENGEMDLSIELVSPVVLRRKGGVEASSIVLAPLWSLSESCEQLSSQAIGSLYTETTLADGNCRLLRFGGELDLTDVLPGEYAGSLDVILRSGENEETHSVEVDVTVIPAQRVITIGPGGVRFNTSREVPVALTEEQNLSIYPDVAFMTEEQPHGAFELSNPSLIPLEVTVSARFGYTEATAAGREVVVEDTSGSHLGDLSSLVDIHPGVLVLMPGEKGLVRYGVQEGALAAMEEKGYAAFFDVASEPRQYVRSDRMPEEVAGDRTARVTMRVPGVYVPAEGASQLRATLLSVSFVGSPSATFLVETEDRPFAGEVVAYDGEGRELGRRETLVYTRSRVRIPLDRLPEEDTVFLRFVPRGSGRVPAPASVEWGAPRRDIGAAAKDRTATPETLARKP